MGREHGVEVGGKSAACFGGAREGEKGRAQSDLCGAPVISSSHSPADPAHAAYANGSTASMRTAPTANVTACTSKLHDCNMYANVDRFGRANTCAVRKTVDVTMAMNSWSVGEWLSAIKADARMSFRNSSTTSQSVCGGCQV